MNTAKARLLLVFIFLLAMRQLIMGAEDEQTGTSAPFVLEVGSGTVDVHCPDGRLVQSLPYSGDEPDDRNRDFFAFVRDLDFDGFSDVGILYSQGMQNIYYDAWLWRPDARVFVKYEEMHEVASPDFDADRKRVRSYAHVSATDNVTIDYAWENGRLVAVEQKIQEYSPETDTFSIRRYTRGDDGELRLVEEKTLSPEEMEGLADNAEDTDDRDSNAAPAADAILVNNLRFEIEAVYAHAPGHRPWKIAGPLVDGETARVDTSTLQGSRRLIVKKKDEHEETPPLQFFNTSYLGDVGRMELAFRGGIPTLLTFEDGIFDAAMTGLPFGILLSFLELETGMDTAAYADLMMPLAADGWESYAFAVTSGDISWRLLPPGPVFRKGGDGRKYLSSIAFGADMMRHELFWFLDEFHAHRIAPKTLIMEDGTAYAFGEESRNHPNALPVEKTADETLLEILKKRLNEWIDLHGSPERGDMRLLLESPEALYELRINLDTEAAEWSFQRKGDEVMPKEFYLTLFADFPGETWKKEVGPLPVENEPASPSLIAFYLADELSAWTRFDFTLNDVIFGEDSITVDWSKESTLLAGLDDRAQNEEFPVYFHDAASLNWFMLDSLALTLKNNLDITTVYYCSEGGPVTFTNPEDMAALGLPELTVDQPYEGISFFSIRTRGRGGSAEKNKYLIYTIEHAYSAEGNMANAMTQAEMTMTAAAASDAWDEELNRIYSMLIEKLSASEAEALTISQYEWIKYRDGEIDNQRKEWEGGSGQSAAMSIVNIIATKNRTLELIDYYFDGILPKIHDEYPPVNRDHLSLEEALRIYAAHVNEVRNDGWPEYGVMSLIYVDGDDIPELVIDWGTTAGGGQVFTVSNGELVDAYVESGGMSYIERQNIFHSSGGRQGSYFDAVFTIENGEFIELCRGEHGDGPTDDEENPYTFYWRWEGKEVTESEYEERLRSAFDNSKAISSHVNTYTADEMLQKINELIQ